MANDEHMTFVPRDPPPRLRRPIANRGVAATRVAEVSLESTSRFTTGSRAQPESTPMEFPSQAQTCMRLYTSTDMAMKALVRVARHDLSRR